MTTFDTLAIVVPVYNEAGLLVRSAARIMMQAESAGMPLRLILIDDGSHDDSLAVMNGLAAADTRIEALAFTRNFGKEAAILAGIDHALSHADTAAVLVMDADLQHPPELIAQFVALWRDGAMVVEGVRANREGDGLFKRLGAGVFHHLFAHIAGVDLSGVTDFKLLDRRVAEQMQRLGERARFFRGLVHWLGHETVQVPFVVPARGVGGAGEASGTQPSAVPGDTGQTRWSTSALIRYAWSSLTAFSSVPLRLITLLGALGLVLGLVLAVKAIIDKLSGVALDGFSTVILLSVIFSSLILISLGIVGSYLARIYDELKARPVYVLRQQTTGRGTRRSSPPPAAPDSDCSPPPG